MDGHEPPWRYGLAEVIYQFLTHNGDLPLLAAHDFLRERATDRPAAASRHEYVGELDILDPDGVKHELDILLADWTELWVGEATTKSRLENTNNDEHERLQRFRETADLLSARGALLITSGAWEPNTVARARAAFQGIWPRLEIIETARQAQRWSSPAPTST
jgi:hypothetical protein